MKTEVMKSKLQSRISQRRKVIREQEEAIASYRRTIRAVPKQYREPMFAALRRERKLLAVFVDDQKLDKSLFALALIQSHFEAMLCDGINEYNMAISE